MTYSDFVYKIADSVMKLVDNIRIVYNVLIENYIFRTIIFILLISFALWILFWFFKILLMIIDYRFYKETADMSDERIMLNRWDMIQQVKPSKAERAEMEKMLAEFNNESEDYIDDVYGDDYPI